MEIKVYGSNECPYCNLLKRYLKMLKVPFIYVDVDQNENEKEYIEVINILNHTLIPVVKIDGEFMSPEKEFNTIAEAVKKIFIKYWKEKKKSKKSG